jgi:hypothetical protein
MKISGINKPQRICPFCNKKTENEICPKCKEFTVLETLYLIKKNDSLIGKPFTSKYKILDLIGCGGMGKVYLANQIPR